MVDRSDRSDAPVASAEQRLKDLGIALPAAPKPLGSYVAAVRRGNLLFLSGMLPVVGGEPRFFGRIGADLSIADGQQAAVTAVLNGLAVIRAQLGSLDKVDGIAKLGVYIATADGFRDHPKVADGASDLLLKVFGPEMLSPRVVLGVASLPLGLAVEVELLVEVAD
jgi:enamine deaminase RidA (YjgF/YER057c/UK114 family)